MMPVIYKIAVYLQEILDDFQNALKTGLFQNTTVSLQQTDHSTKKILIVCSHFWPSIGGIESRIEQFSSELVKAGYGVSIMTLEHPGRDSDVRNEVKIISINPQKRVGIVRAWPYMIRKTVRSGDYDVCVLIQQPFGEIISSLEGATPAPNTKLIIQPIIMADGYAWMKDKARFCRRFSAILKSSTATVVMTKNGPDRQFMDNNDVSAVYIPNATALPETTGNFRNKYGIGEDCFLILHAANLYWVKNHLGLINTLCNLPKSWRLVMIGNPTGQPDCAAAVAAKLEQHPEILFIPGLNRSDVSSAMESADVIVLSSFGEGSPNTILEAMSHKKPWLATPECGAVNDNAGGLICVLPEFIEHLSVLQKSHDLRSQLGEIGYRHWQECYSWQPVIDSWLELIETGKLSYSLAAPLQIDSEMIRLRDLIAARIISLKSEIKDVL